MPNTLNNLQEMGLFLIRSLDSSKKQIEQINTTSDGSQVLYKDGTSAPIRVAVDLTPSLFCNGFVVVKNTKENVQALIENWTGALSFEKLVILFLDDKTGNKWLLRPHIHAKIAEPKTLAQGLRTLFEHSMGKA